MSSPKSKKLDGGSRNQVSAEARTPAAPLRECRKGALNSVLKTLCMSSRVSGYVDFEVDLK